MEPHDERRHCDRYAHTSPMHLYRMDYQDQHYYAEMKDYSRCGLSLLTREKLVIGQFVYLEMKNFSDSAPGPEQKKSYSGSVKWTAPYSPSHSDTNGTYQYGIEYFDAVDYQC